MFSVRRSISLKRPKRLVLCCTSPHVCKPSLCNSGTLARVEVGAIGCTGELLVVAMPSSRSTAESPIQIQQTIQMEGARVRKHKCPQAVHIHNQTQGLAKSSTHLVGKRRCSCLIPSLRRQGSASDAEAPRVLLLGTQWRGRVLSYPLVQDPRQHPRSQQVSVPAA